MGCALLSNYWAQHEFRKLTSADTSNLHTDNLPFYDRWAAGLFSKNAALTSDILITGALLPLILSGTTARREGKLSIFIIDVVMFSESLALSSALNIWIRSQGNRPRPLVHNSSVPLTERLENEASSSFYSGHTSAAFLTAVFTSYVFQVRNPQSDWTKWIWSGTLSIAGLVAGLRVYAGKHYPSDVIAGAGIGAAFGFFIPWAHLNPGTSGKVTFLPTPSGGNLYFRF
jgi:membrane-associated phospholipid phosphatase